MLRRAGIATAITLLVVVAFGALASGALSHGLLGANIARGAIALIALAALVWLVFRTTDIKPPPGIGTPRPLPPANEEIALAYINMVTTYNADALKLFINMMVDRPNYLERINEVVSVEEESPQLEVVTRQVFRTLVSGKQPGITTGERLSSSSSADSGESPADGSEKHNVTLIPLVLVEKGTLLDRFKVIDASGCEVPTLSYNQTRGLLAYVIRTIISDVIPEPLASSYTGDELQKIKAKVAANLVTAICSPGPKKRKSQQEQERIERLLESTAELPTTDEWKQRVRSFCDTLVSNYVIVAETPLPIGGYLLLAYTQAVSVDSSYLTLINRFRSRLGLRYSTFDIPVNVFALDVEAYHMEMNAGPMQYVFDHHLERMNSKDRLTQNELSRGVNKPYVRLHYNTAGPAMHLYIRRQSESIKHAPSSNTESQVADGPAPRLKSVVEFREIPPGTLGAVTLVSLMTAAVVVFFALTQIGQGSKIPGGPLVTGSDIPALVIALPGLASLVIGSWLDLSHLRRSSLATYVGLAACVVLSFASALYFLLDANKSIPGRISLSVSSGVVIQTDIGWLVLATIAIACSLYLVRDVISSSRYYFNQVKNRVRRLT
jgi:hypothetical protein